MEQVKETGKSPLYVYWQAALPDRGKLLLTLLLACLAAALEIVLSAEELALLDKAYPAPGRKTPLDMV